MHKIQAFVCLNICQVLEGKWNVKRSPGLHGRAGKGKRVASKLVWSTLPSLLKIHHPARAPEEESCFWGWLHNFVLKWTYFIITVLVLFAPLLCVWGRLIKRQRAMLPQLLLCYVLNSLLSHCQSLGWPRRLWSSLMAWTINSRAVLSAGHTRFFKKHQLKTLKSKEIIEWQPVDEGCGVTRVSILGLTLALEEKCCLCLSYICDAEISQELGKILTQ